MFTASLIFCQKMLTSRKVLKSFTIFQFVHQYVSSGVFVSWAASDTALDHACLRLMDRPAERRPFWIPTRESPTRTEEGAARTGRGPRGAPVGAGGKQDVSAAMLRTGPAGALGRGPGNRVRCLRDPRGRRGQARPRQLREQPAGGEGDPLYATWLPRGVAVPPHTLPPGRPAPRRDGATAGRGACRRAEEQVPALTRAHVRPPCLQSGPTGAPSTRPSPGSRPPDVGRALTDTCCVRPRVCRPAPSVSCSRRRLFSAPAKAGRRPGGTAPGHTGQGHGWDHPPGRGRRSPANRDAHRVRWASRDTCGRRHTSRPKSSHGQEGGHTLNEVTATEEAWVEQRKKLHGESGTCG